MVRGQRSGASWRESVLPFHHVGLKDGTWVGVKCVYLLSHLVSPSVVTFKLNLHNTIWEKWSQHSGDTEKKSLKMNPPPPYIG